MHRPSLHRTPRLLLGLWLVMLACGTVGLPARPALSSTEAGAPATLRLAQVVPRLPAIHIYAVAQDERGIPVSLQPSELSALLGSASAPVALGSDDGIGVVFLIDVSASLRKPQYDLIIASVIEWIASLRPVDRAAVVTLGSSVRTLLDFTADKAKLTRTVQRLVFTDQQTLLYQGLVQAIDLSRRLDRSLPLRRAIVILTDGLDDQTGGAGRQEVLDKLAVDAVPIYGIGASTSNNKRVDDALKDFASIARLSGGDFRRVDLKTLDAGYRALRTLVDATGHFTVRCAACVPDGSAINVRLDMTRGSARLDSGSAAVRLVGTDGNVVPQTPVTPPRSEQRELPPPPPPPKQPDKGWAFNIKLILNVPWQWGVLAALALFGSGTTGYVIYKRRQHETDTSGNETHDDPDSPDGLRISRHVLIVPGTQQNRQRLRLYPLGHNDLKPRDLLFETTLTVGRDPKNDICINNDGQVSADHCTLAPSGNTILVQDVGSRNGTRLNGVPINGFIHAEADSVLGCGRTELRMKLLRDGAR
jgi:hypothetical protein